MSPKPLIALARLAGGTADSGHHLSGRGTWKGVHLGLWAPRQMCWRDSTQAALAFWSQFAAGLAASSRCRSFGGGAATWLCHKLVSSQTQTTPKLSASSWFRFSSLKSCDVFLARFAQAEGCVRQSACWERESPVRVCWEPSNPGHIISSVLRNKNTLIFRSLKALSYCLPLGAILCLKLRL